MIFHYLILHFLFTSKMPKVIFKLIDIRIILRYSFLFETRGPCKIKPDSPYSCILQELNNYKNNNHCPWTDSFI